jgi:Predicted cobalamin binding protein
MAKLQEVAAAVETGKLKLIEGIVQEALDEGSSVTEVLNCMIDTMGVVGDKFQRNEIFVPEMLVSALTMKKGVGVLQPLMVDSDATSLGTCIIGTVAGDLHDIGKNLVALMIESAGFNVIDLGVDVSNDKFIETYKANPDAKIIAVSGLLTTTMDNMKQCVKALIDAGVKNTAKIMVGGAPITQEFADEIGADGYTADAGSAAVKAKELAS